MPLSRRYSPEHPPGESCNYGLDYSFIIPPGVGIASGTLTIWHHIVPPTAADADWTVGAVSVRGRVVYALLTGGVEGKDYELRWVATDTSGNKWPRTGLQLCAQTS